MSLRDQTEGFKILRTDVLKKIVGIDPVTIGLTLIANRACIQSAGDVALNTIKRTSGDEKDVGGIHFNEFLVGVFAPS